MKARAARKANYYPARMTPKRLATARANIRKTQASPAVGGSKFRHGLFSVSLRQSLARAGETPEALDAHIKLFNRVFALPRSDKRPSAPLDYARLVQSAAELTWRRLRAYWGIGQWEARQLRRVFERAPASEFLTAARAASLALEIMDVFLRYVTTLQPLGRLNRRLEEVFQEVVKLRSRREARFGLFIRTRHKQPPLTGAAPAAISNPLSRQ